MQSTFEGLARCITPSGQQITGADFHCTHALARRLGPAWRSDAPRGNPDPKGEFCYIIRAQVDARVGERTRIARELHDTLLQSFHGLLLRFQAASELLSTRPVEAKQTLDDAIDQAAQAITEGRDAAIASCAVLPAMR
jgi:hypothetical protein